MYAPYNSNTTSRPTSLAVKSIEKFSGFDLQVGNDDQTSRGDSGYSRALVKDQENGKPKLVVNYAGDYPSGVHVHGSGMKVDGNLTVQGVNMFQPLTNQFDFILGSGNQTDRGDSGYSRALVKLPGGGGKPELAINYAGDYPSGVRVMGSGMNVDGNLTVQGRSIIDELNAIKAQIGL